MEFVSRTISVSRTLHETTAELSRGFAFAERSFGSRTTAFPSEAVSNSGEKLPGSRCGSGGR